MPIPPGTRLGAYEITSAIGAGGMGEVYRARDTRLLRDVAIKVLPTAVAADPDRLRRFEHEARATAALNHPNILAVHDVGRDGEVAFVVEELLDGETLREALSATLPSRKVIDYATQIANGLAAAHDKGIVHRDLKPENIFITRDGRVKILDFGLAKTVAPAAAQTSTRLADDTEPGVALGTVGYMAPEQVRGHAVDHRADVFSLGAVLYEMLTGRRAFGGDTAADTISAVLKEAPPDPADTGRPIPPALARIVWRCLEKTPSMRFQTATDLAFALQALSSESTASGAGSQLAVARRVRPAWAVPVLMLVAGSVLGGLAVWLLRPASPAVDDSPVRFTLSRADGLEIDDLTRAVVSPDGRRIALAEAIAGNRQLTVLTLADGSRKDLGIAGVGAFGWSPDGSWLAYFGVDRSLNKVSLESQQRQRLAALEWAPTTVSWSTSGDIYLASAVSSALTVVPSTGGQPRSIFADETGKPTWLSAQALPDGRRLLLSRGGGDAAEILLANADGSGHPTVIGNGLLAQFVEPDILLAQRGTQIVAWRTDLSGGKLTGQPTAVADGLLVRGSPLMGFSASPNGILVYRSESHELRTRLAWVDRSGRESAQLLLDGHCRNPELSPAFDRVAVECYQPGGARDVWIYDLARDAATRLTTDAGDDADPLWSPDGRSVIFASSRRGNVDVFRTAVGGGGAEELVHDTRGSTPTMAISPDGKQIVVLATAPDSGLDLAAYPVEPPGSPVSLLKSPAAEIEAQFHPGGNFLAYASNQSGRFEVYVEPLPQTGDRWSISTAGGTDARWSPDGREIFYLTPDRRLMSVPIRTTPSFVAGRPVELFQTRIAGPLGLGHRFPFAVWKDAQRFLMYVSDPDGPPPALTAISNWTRVLGR